MMVNMIFRCTIWILVVGSGLVARVHSHDQSGFISIDCGLSDASGYIDPTTTIQYTSDTEFTTTGTNMDIARVYQDTRLPRQLATVRSFPQGTRNCYTLTPPNGTGTNYLIRASFMYGNYDSIDRPPTFDLHIGVDVWDTIKLDNSTQVVVKEMIHTPFSEHLDVCLVNTGKGTPIISTLELRHLNSIIYNRGSGSLVLVSRLYADNKSTESIRYNDDVYDRIWEPFYLRNESLITTSSTVDTSAGSYKLPSAAMSSAIIPKAGSKSFNLSWTQLSSEEQYYDYMHFAELEKLSDNGNETREFDIMSKGSHIFGPVSPIYLVSETVYPLKPRSGSKMTYTLKSTEKSTLPPIINAIELYMAKELSQPTTNQADVAAMMDVKSTYDVTKNWQGDPCSPWAYSWSGVNCSYDSHTATVISLNLSSSGITGEIAKSISNLTSLQVLDLSNNDLTGGIPDFLADLAHLKILYLGGNMFTSTSVPPALTEKSNRGLLDLSLEDNRNQCSGGSCSNKKSTKLIVIIVASISAVVVIAAIVICTVCLMKRIKNKQSGGVLQGEREIDQPRHVHVTKKGRLSRFSHSEVTEMTKGFEKQLGKGGFGTVYYGRLKDGTEVAAKVLQQSIQGSEQFETEVELLMAVRHKNLVSLIGYCDEENKLALIYEYMAKCDLQSLIIGSDILSWKQRLQIAIDSAQGLDYLHNGCRPPIVHRDVKTPNILLDDNMHAKVADFGLSKMFPDEYKSYMTTRVIGTPGYLDPEYHITQQLNEKSDVYSFGIVLLELITGKTAVSRANLERTNLIHWVSQMLNRGDIWNIVDQRLQDAKNLNSFWRVTDIAMACVKPTSNERPTMSKIVTELKECLAMETEMNSQRNSNISIGPNDSIGMNPVISFTAMDPKAR